MSITSEATTLWTGDLKSGSGSLGLDSSGAAEFPVNWKARSDGEKGVTNPEELLGAAHSACYSMALSNILTSFGTTPQSIQTTAAVTFDPAQGITGSHLLVNARVPGISEADFDRLADEAKRTCPVSRALTGISITLEANLA
jgi:osmotically inducible protein OsmC